MQQFKKIKHKKTGQCTTYTTMFFFAAGNDNVIDRNELCDANLWKIIEDTIPNFAVMSDYNCSKGFDWLDRVPRDNKVSGFEILIFMSGNFDIYIEKAVQIDCTECFDNPTDFYGNYTMTQLRNACLENYIYYKRDICYLN